jgi:hypothetical protein
MPLVMNASMINQFLIVLSLPFSLFLVLTMLQFEFQQIERSEFNFFCFKQNLNVIADEGSVFVEDHLES